MSPPAPRTFYLENPDAPVFAIFHAPGPNARDTAVIFCPPFGWDEVCSYRSRRHWAQHLANAGYPSLRISYPGTGDSGGSPADPARLEAWTAAVDSATSWLREAAGASRIVAVGLGLGGLVAYRAAALGAPIDDLVMWATPARGRALVRQLRVFSRLEVSRFFEGLELPPPLPEGELEAGGFRLSSETIRDLDDLDLASLPLPDPAARHVLLLDRDGIAVDAKLQEALESQGVQLTVSPGPGYAAMTSHPQQAQSPGVVMGLVTRWLNQFSATAVQGASEPSTPAAAGEENAIIETHGGTRVKETPLTIEQPFGRLSGVLTEPLGPREEGLCAVFLNAGAVRSIGPSRMWVEATRRWAARGIPTLRLDVEGIGDSDGDGRPYVDDGALYEPRLVPQVLDVLDFLQRRGVGQRFVLAGLCAGAYWSFHGAIQDPRVSSALMLNPRALVWDPALAPARDFRRLLLPATWRKIRREASVARVRALLTWLLASPMRIVSRSTWFGSSGLLTESEVDRLLDRLRASGKPALMLFSASEPLDQELVRSGRMVRIDQWDNVTVEYIQVRDHTLRPSWAQSQAHAAIDRALDRELENRRTE
jgi:pimeloyl-ACP methyl ester carboxylesterase